MRYLKLLFSLTLFLSIGTQLKAQIPSQGLNGNIDNVTIANIHLVGGKIKLSSAATTSVKYNVDMSRSISGPNAWHSVSMKVGLGYKVGNDYKFFEGAYTFKNGDFINGSATLYKELISVIDHSKLPTGAKIYILYENYSLPASAWHIQAYATPNVVAYDFVPAVVPGPVVGTPPAFSAPVVGSVPLYEYASSTKRVLTTTYYSSYPGYTYNGIFGFVFSSATPGTVPLYKYVKTSNGNNFYTISQATYTGYIYEGIVAYVYANQVTKTLPVYEHYQSSGQFHRFTNGPDSFAGYVNNDFKFYILQNKQVTTYPLPEDDCQELYEYYSNDNTDHFYTSIKYPDGVYYYERVLGYVYTIKKPGTVALYSYYNPSIQDHFYTTTRNESGAYVYTGITGYVYLSAGVTGTVGIYEHYSDSWTNHYYNNVYSDHSPRYYNVGIKFYMLQYNH